MSFEQSDKDVKQMADYLNDIANNIMKKVSANMDDLVKKLSKDVDTMTNDELRSYMAKLSIESYNLGIQKEQSSLKDACATALYKEGVARSFNESVGTVEARRNQSTLDTANQQAVQILYNAICNMMKTKLDEAHRLVNTLNGILISRSADAKLYYSPRNAGDNAAEDFIDTSTIDRDIPF